MFCESPIKVNLSLGDHDRGKVVSDSSTLGYNWAIRSTCWFASEFEDEQVGLLPAAILVSGFSRYQVASLRCAKQHGTSYKATHMQRINLDFNHFSEQVLKNDLYSCFGWENLFFLVLAYISSQYTISSLNTNSE